MKSSSLMKASVVEIRQNPRRAAKQPRGKVIGSIAAVIVSGSARPVVLRKERLRRCPASYLQISAMAPSRDAHLKSNCYSLRILSDVLYEIFTWSVDDM